MRRPSVVVVVVAFALLAGAPPALAACPDADTAVTAENRPVVAAAVLCLVDEHRAAQNLPLLRRNAILGETAQHHADRIGSGQDEFEHSSEGKSTDRRAKERGYQGFAGENLAGGRTAREAVDLLMRDAPHRESLMDTGNDEVGAGAAAHPEYGGVVSIVVGASGAGGGQSEGPSRPPAYDAPGERTSFFMHIVERIRGRRVRVAGGLNGRKVGGGSVTVRVTRGKRVVTRRTTAGEGIWVVEMPLPKGSGRITVTAATTVAGKRLTRTRRVKL